MLKIRNHLYAVLLVSAAVLGSGCGSSAKAPSATTTASSALPIPRVPVRDTFAGALHGGTGSMAGARDAVQARIQAPGRTGTRRLTLWIITTGCRAGAPCVHLSGSLRGQLRQVRTLPDIGRRYAVEATGSLGPVGVVTATGTAAGIGNINSGFETLKLTLAGKRGSARLDASSGRVPSFTSP